jgi:hypothetical protein
MPWDMEEGFEAPTVQPTSGWDMEEGYEPPSGVTTIDTSTMDIGKERPSGVYVPPIGEDTGGTISPQEKQYREDIAQVEEMGTEIEQVGKATQTMIDSFTGKNTEKRDKNIARVLKEKYGATVEKRGEDKVIVLSNGSVMDYPASGDMLDTLGVAKGEAGGATAGAIGGGMIAGPVGAAVGGAIGAGLGAYYDIGEAAEETGTEVSEEDRLSMATEAGVTDIALGTTMALGGKAISNILSTKTVKEFTSLANLPKAERDRIATLQKTTGMSDEQMEANIKQYASTIEGRLPETEAIKAAAQGSYKEQTGFLYKAALRSSDAKANLISEIDDRSKQIAKAFEGDEELMGIYTKNTKTDKDRSATNWKGLYDDLVKAGVTEDEPIMATIKQNSDTFNTYEKDLFTALVSPDSAEAKNLIEGVGFRSNPKGQSYAMTLSVIKSAYDSMFGDNITAVKAINKALANRATKPKKLEQELIEAGVETNRAREAVAKVEADKIKLKEAEEAKVTKATEAKEKTFEKVIAKEEKTGSAMEAGIDKDVTEFKKTKTAMQKEKKVEEVKLAKESKEELKMQKESMKRAGIDWDEANLDATVSKKDKARLKEARRRAQMDAVPMGTSDADTAVAKIQQEILDKKQAVVDRKAKLDVLKQEAEKPSAMEAGIKKKTRKPTPNQVEAQKLKEADPDNKEAIKKALIKKSPEVQAKKTAEEGVAKEAMEKENYTSSKKSLKKKVNTVEDMDNLKEVTRNPNSTDAERVESRRRRRAVASREAFGSDDLAVKYKEWGDDSRSGFGDFIVEKKDELNLDYEQVKKYYEVQGDVVPTKVKKAYTAKAMKAGIKARDYTKELGEEGNKAYNAWASKVRGNAKEGSSPNVSLSKFKRSADGKPYRGE